MNCPDCQGELDLQEDGDVVLNPRPPHLRWVSDHTDAVCLDCEAEFRIGRDGRIVRNEAATPLDEVFK